MITLKRIATGAAAMMASAVAVAAHAQTDELTVAYFLEWPMPFQYGKVTGAYEDALGVKINWRAFDTGTAMSAAMASGDVHISVSQGVPPFVVATSAGQDLQVVDVAVSYSENDNCVVRTALEIDKTTALDLEGSKVGVPIGTAAHYGFLKQMAHFGVDISTMTVVDMPPADGAAALSQGSLDMACGWGGALARMREHGNVLLTGAEKEELGIQVFDVTSAPARFVKEEPELLGQFLAVTAAMNAKYVTDAATMLPVIAKDSGMTEAGAADMLTLFTFPPVSAQLSEKWLGGGTQRFLKEVADFFVEQDQIPEARDSYEDAVNIGPLSAGQ